MYIDPNWTPAIRQMLADALVNHFKDGKEYVLALSYDEAHVKVDGVMHHVMWDGVEFEDGKLVLKNIQPYKNRWYSCTVIVRKSIA